MQMSKKIDNPRKTVDSEEKGEPVNTLYDNMLFRRSTDGVVNYPSVGSGSDYAPFLQIIGTSVIDINFASDGYYPGNILNNVRCPKNIPGKSRLE